PPCRRVWRCCASCGPLRRTIVGAPGGRRREIPLGPPAQPHSSVTLGRRRLRLRLKRADDLAGHRPRRATGDRPYRVRSELGCPVGGEETVAFLLRVGQLRIAEPGDRRAVEDGAYQLLVLGAQRLRVAGRDVAPPRLTGGRPVGDPAE